jgi:hypothetical protein
VSPASAAATMASASSAATAATSLIAATSMVAGGSSECVEVHLALGRVAADAGYAGWSLPKRSVVVGGYMGVAGKWKLTSFLHLFS